MLIINIVLALVAALLLLGVIGEKDGLKQQNITIAFVAVIVLIRLILLRLCLCELQNIRITRR